ncbi:type II toxin-antitoxin system HipA family toxin [Inhella gelatinilytica]|uniref:HipA domain-containing protein n=1 Tax=Inhella gelatinilytica TaxID=2795030 RepID=A0A931IZT5_9BURK|nr:HipA domain-containing protein [Inhella gelatinilytica]MBH9553588.1 HipA domain-containing protein [Inhella gelatinilytica]
MVTAASPLDVRQPLDTLYLWWTGEPTQPALIGELKLVRASRGVSLRYAPSWLQTGFALSEDLPLIDSEFLPRAPEVAAGAVDDAKPDRWGERVIRFLDKPPRLSLMEYLYFAGDERFGALGVSTSQDQYQPRRFGPLPGLADVAQLHELVKKVAAGEPVPEAQRRLIVPSVTMGGARPKALLNLQGAQWILKFGDLGEPFDSPLVEHATMTLAARARIRVAVTQAIPLVRGHAIAIKRFDRLPLASGVRRLHALSANVALHAAGEPLGYPELAQLLRRRGVAKQSVGRAQMAELFRRMVFNILIDNTDDHEKNHALLMNEREEYELSPAFDVLPTGQALGYQQMRVGADAADATLANALSEHALFGLRRHEAESQVREVAAVVAGWKPHFAAHGVRPADIDSLAQQIDRPFLTDQRGNWG